MEAAPSTAIEVDPQLTADQLFEFYQRNDICEVGFGKDVAARILHHPHLIVAALYRNEVVGLARATFDGLSAHVMEFSLDLRWQGQTRHNNGSLVEADPQGLGRALGERLLQELARRGCTFVTGYVVDACEETFLRDARLPPECRAQRVLHRQAAVRKRRITRHCNGPARRNGPSKNELCRCPAGH